MLVPSSLAHREKGLLAVPFVLHAQPIQRLVGEDGHSEERAANTHRRYAEIMEDVEGLIRDHSAFLAHMSKRIAHAD